MDLTHGTRGHTLKHFSVDNVDGDVSPWIVTAWNSLAQLIEVGGMTFFAASKAAASFSISSFPLGFFDLGDVLCVYAACFLPLTGESSSKGTSFPVSRFLTRTTPRDAACRSMA